MESSEEKDMWDVTNAIEDEKRYRAESITLNTLLKIFSKFWWIPVILNLAIILYFLFKE